MGCLLALGFSLKPIFIGLPRHQIKGLKWSPFVAMLYYMVLL